MRGPADAQTFLGRAEGGRTSETIIRPTETRSRGSRVASSIT